MLRLARMLLLGGEGKSHRDFHLTKSKAHCHISELCSSADVGT